MDTKSNAVCRDLEALERRPKNERSLPRPPLHRVRLERKEEQLRPDPAHPAPKSPEYVTHNNIANFSVFGNTAAPVVAAAA